MKCPKCHYLSFEPEPRCRNCGYAFSPADEELPLMRPDPPQTTDSLGDLRLRDVAPAERPSVFASLGSDGEIGGLSASAAGRPSSSVPPVPAATAAPPARPKTPAGPKRPAAERPVMTAELPLFVRGMPSARDEETAAPIARTPEDSRAAVVRRSVPDPAAATEVRPSPGRPLGPLDRDLLQDLERIERRERTLAARESADTSSLDAVSVDEVASASARLVSAAIDGIFLAAVSAAVLWVVLRWCGLPAARAAVLPMAPTVAFLLVVGLGYLLMFTVAGGQTIGKMFARLRVVDDAGPADARHLTARQAAWRACLTLPSVLILGLGFLPALLGSHRALHDRWSHTRVVRE